RDLRLQRGNARGSGFELGTRARGVELGAAAGAQARVDQAQRLALVGGILACHAQALLQAAQVEVRAGHLADDRDLRGSQVRRARGRVRAACLDTATDPAEQVQLPARLDPGAVGLGIAAVAVDARQLVAAGAAIAAFG